MPMDSDAIRRELDQIWNRATSGLPQSVPLPPAPPSFSLSDAPSITREASLETIAMIKRQHREELARLAQYVELKDASVRELSARLREADQELARLRRKSQRGDEAVYQQIVGVSAELESARDGLKEQESRFREEEKVLRAIAERTREQLGVETTHWRELEHGWNEREQEYLLKLRELEGRAQQAQEDAARHEGRSRKSLTELQEAKAAIEGTLSELLRERSEREASEKDRQKALSRVKEVEEHLRELQNLWDEERKQWQELWDRERSTWETQRREFGEWEGKVRKEREEWHLQLRGLEGRENKYRDQMAEILRSSADAGEKLSGFLKQATDKAKQVASAEPAKPPPPRNWKKIAAGSLAALLLAASYPVWVHLNRLRFNLLQSHAVLIDGPTGLSFNGTALWMSAWDGTLYSLDPERPSEVLTKFRVQEADPYHPVAVSVWGDALYSLDSAQGRILRHGAVAPAKVDLQWASPGPAPITLAHDGQNLWSYDAATRAVYRHLGDGKDSQAEAYRVELDLLPTAMAWLKNDLWLYDAKGKRLLLLRVEGKTFKLVKEAALATPLQGMVLGYRGDEKGGQRLELWGLSLPSSGAEPPTIVRFHIL